MGTNIQQFEAEIEAALDLPEDTVVPVAKQAAREAIVKLVRRTPRDPDRGEARGGWNTTIGATSDAQTGRRDLDGGETISASHAVIETMTGLDRIVHQNAVPHANILDKGLFVPSDPGPSKDPRPQRKGRILVQGGFSTQAPRGMVGITFDEVVAKYTRRLRGA